MLRLALLSLLALPLAACADDEADVADPAVDPAPDATAELPDPDPDTPLDVDPLSRQDGLTSDEAALDSAETGEDVLPSMGDRIGPDSTDQ